jgi:hypothetical protein
VQNTAPLNVLGHVVALQGLIMSECPVSIPRHSLHHDCDTASRRLQSEGLPFVTVVLPRLGKAVDTALETGQLLPVPGFGHAHESELPAFMQDVLRYVFKDDGTLVPVTAENAAIVGLALKHIRTVCYFAYKLDVGYDSEVEALYEDAFVSTDLSLPTSIAANDLVETAAYECMRIFGDVPPVEEFKPRHGPGAVAGGEVDEEKWQFDPLPLKSILRGFWPLFHVGPEHRKSEELWCSDETTVSRIAFVPKDSRGPRVIAIEPKELQWLQQAIREAIVPRLEFNTGFRINFVDQTVNQRLAMSSSITRDYATLDMKDASDRVSLALAEAILPPDWFGLINSTRSEATVLPSGRVLTLSKLSSMGSATTFPVEAAIFWCIAVAAISLKEPGRRQLVRRNVFVYGDDLIVPSAHASCVMDALESVGLLVNRHKSFVTGFFRESCGVDAYHGFDVTPVRMKKLPPTRRTDGALSSSLNDLADRLDQAGYSQAANYLYTTLERLYGDLPYGLAGCGYLHRLCHGGSATAFLLSRDYTRWRWNSRLQRLEMKVWAVEKRSRLTTLDGWSRLLRNLTQGCGDRPDHIAPTHGRVILRRSWRTVTR